MFFKVSLKKRVFSIHLVEIPTPCRGYCEHHTVSSSSRLGRRSHRSRCHGFAHIPWPLVGPCTGGLNHQNCTVLYTHLHLIKLQCWEIQPGPMCRWHQVPAFLPPQRHTNSCLMPLLHSTQAHELPQPLSCMHNDGPCTR